MIFYSERLSTPNINMKKQSDGISGIIAKVESHCDEQIPASDVQERTCSVCEKVLSSKSSLTHNMRKHVVEQLQEACAVS